MGDFGSSIPILYPDFGDLIPGENPLRDGANWSEYSTRPPLMVSSSGTAIHGTREFVVNGSLFAAETFLGNVIEAYGCRPESGLGAANESNRIVALIGDPNSYVGYSSGFGGGIGEEYFFRRYDGGPPDSWATLATGPSSPRPSKLGIRLTPDAVEQWGFYSGAWHLVNSAADTTYRGLTRIALETEEQGGTEEVTWTCFAVGSPRRTQFFRWSRTNPGENVIVA